MRFVELSVFDQHAMIANTILNAHIENNEALAKQPYESKQLFLLYIYIAIKTYSQYNTVPCVYVVFVYIRFGIWFNVTKLDEPSYIHQSNDVETVGTTPAQECC